MVLMYYIIFVWISQSFKHECKTDGYNSHDLYPSNLVLQEIKYLIDKETLKKKNQLARFLTFSSINNRLIDEWKKKINYNLHGDHQEL